MDWRYIEGELEKLGLKDDESGMRALANALFDPGVPLPEEALSAEQRALLSTIVSSGTYGTIELRVKNTIRKKGWGKLRYMVQGGGPGREKGVNGHRHHPPFGNISPFKKRTTS